MTYKKLLRYIVIPTLVLGVSIILGFLSFSGIYILLPILALAIAAFVLSVGFEGEIYYQNIKSALKSLTTPSHVKRRIAKKCLKEELLGIEAEIKLFEELTELEGKKGLLKRLSEFNDKLNIGSNNKQELINEYKAILNDHDGLYKQSFPLPATSWLQKALNPPKPGLLTFGKEANHMEEFQHGLKSFSDEINRKLTHPLNNYPPFFTDYFEILKIDHNHAHLNLDTESKNRKNRLEFSLSLMEKFFADQLFHAQDKKLTGEDANLEENFIKYRNELRDYLDEKHRSTPEKPNIWIQQLSKKTKLDIGGIVISSVCGLFMMLGTSYLLVEAFSVVPFFAAIPFGALPFIIVPVAVLAGTAFGLLTYSAIDEIIHEEIFIKRYRKIKDDLESGANPWWIGAKMLALFLIVGLAITLTICTGGTWWTVVKHTKPIFIGLSKIPTAIVGIIAGFLALASFAFNISNALQTYEELEETFEDEGSDDNPYSIRLLEVQGTCAGEVNEVLVSKKLTIIKSDNKYYICGAYGKKDEWRLNEISNSPYSLSNLILNSINFEKGLLKASLKNSLIYLTLKFNKAHTFTHSDETFMQKWNPIRIFLICTYLPLRILLFLGHLISISATSDRIPGIPEVLSMLIGLISEFFEDLHYFANLETTHKNDLKSLINERFSKDGGCNHENDLPTKILRDYVFYPIFYFAASWDNFFKDETKGLSDFILYPFFYLMTMWGNYFKGTVVTESVQETNERAKKEEGAFSNSLNKMMGQDIISVAKIEEEDKLYVDEVDTVINEQATTHQADNDNLDDMDDIDGIEVALLSKFSMFTRTAANTRISAIHINCACHPRMGLNGGAGINP